MRPPSQPTLQSPHSLSTLHLAPAEAPDRRLEVLRHARTLQPGAQRVVLTNYATPDMRRRCAELGAHRVFDKSAELEELLAFCAELVPDASAH